MLLLLGGCFYIPQAELDSAQAANDRVRDSIPSDSDSDSPPDSADSDTDSTAADDSGPDTDSGPAEDDVDDDGFATPEDCDDADPAQHPGAVETCNGEDDDCDDDVDEGAGTFWYADADGDGHGDPALSAFQCAAPDGYVALDDDCDDDAGSTYPGAPELCATDADDDCDGEANEVDATGCGSVYLDEDRDGGALSTPTCVCDPGHAHTGEPAADCDDDDPTASVYGQEVCGNTVDEDCNGVVADCGSPGEDTLSSYMTARIGGSATYDHLGHCLSTAGDLNGDGVTDLAIGGYGVSSYGGATYVFFGRASGAMDTGDADASLTGTGTQEVCPVAGGGDVDGDGADDLVIGATTSTWLFAGPLSGALSTDDAVTSWSFGTAGHTLLGQDLDGDSQADVLLGQSTALRLYAGPITAGALSSSDDDAAITEAAGSSIDAFSYTGADFDGDGVADLAVGASSESFTANGQGAAFVVLGPFSADTSTGAARLEVDGDVEYGYLGSSVAFAGDLDGDGLADLAVGSSSIEGELPYAAGAVWIYPGGSRGTQAPADATAILLGEYGSLCGYALAAGGDSDGDGMDNLVVSAPGWTDGAHGGQVAILRGPLSGTIDLESADLLLDGGSGATVGLGLAAFPDEDGDGFPSLLIGAPEESSTAGAAYLFDLDVP